MKVILAQERFIRTKTGIVIGGAMVKRPPAMSEDAEQVQRLLLNHHRVTFGGAMRPNRLTPLRRPNVIPTHSGLLARFLRWLRGGK
jgi:hypothetical protein